MPRTPHDRERPRTNVNPRTRVRRRTAEALENEDCAVGLHVQQRGGLRAWRGVCARRGQKRRARRLRPRPLEGSVGDSRSSEVRGWPRQTPVCTVAIKTAFFRRLGHFSHPSTRTSRKEDKARVYRIAPRTTPPCGHAEVGLRMVLERESSPWRMGARRGHGLCAWAGSWGGQGEREGSGCRGAHSARGAPGGGGADAAAPRGGSVWDPRGGRWTRDA
ncbi:hypothetical protein DFH09DRAFT_1434608 [Mycena vulgaris]|nr:hypothetical protein DFH09DRAFT_1434608 [Mycena vulgaris]